MEYLLNIAIRMLGALCFFGFYVALGTIVYVVLLTWRSKSMRWDEKTTYWKILFKRNWILIPLFTFGNYVMIGHFIPGSQMNLLSWLFTALIEGPIFTVIVATLLAVLTTLYQSVRYGRSARMRK